MKNCLFSRQIEFRKGEKKGKWLPFPFRHHSKHLRGVGGGIPQYQNGSRFLNVFDTRLPVIGAIISELVQSALQSMVLILFCYSTLSAMPINAGYEYFNAENKYHQAASPKAKLEALQEMARYAPSHKGGQNLRAEISRKIAKLKHEIEKAEEQAAKRGGGSSLAVKKEGAGQIVLMGFPNSGKSTVLKALTNADVEIADYPFATTTPQVGMMDFFGARIQLVELPAIIEGSAEGKAQGTQLLSLARSADAIIFVLDAFSAVEEFRILVLECNKAGIRLNEHRPAIRIQHGEYKGISVSGKQFLKIKLQDFGAFLQTQGIHNAAIVLSEPIVSMQQVRDALDSKLVFKKGLILLNWKGKIVQSFSFNAPKTFEAISFSNSNELVSFKKNFFLLLEKVLVYTKKPGEEPDLKGPLVLPKGSTVANLAQMVHKELAQKLQHVRLFGSNAKFKGQKVPLDYKLQNFDIIEIDV